MSSTKSEFRTVEDVAAVARDLKEAQVLDDTSKMGANSKNLTSHTKRHRKPTRVQATR